MSAFLGLRYPKQAFNENLSLDDRFAKAIAPWTAWSMVLLYKDDGRELAAPRAFTLPL